MAVQASTVRAGVPWQTGEYETGGTTTVGQRGSTFSSITLEPQVTAEQEFRIFVNTLIDKLGALKQERFIYYDNLRRNNSRWANGSRWVLAALGAFAFLLTAVAAASRFIAPNANYDWWLLMAVLVTYAVMTAISFYERSTNKTGAYFRQLGIILTIRDLWSKVQFAILKELTSLKGIADPAAEATARQHICALAEAFCNDLNRVTNGELDQWHTEFLASLSELEKVAQQGSENVSKQVRDSIRGAEKATADARTAAKAAEDAARLGAVNMELSGDFDDEVVIAIDGSEVARTRGKTVALDHVALGLRKFSLHSRKGEKELEASLVSEVKPGLQGLRLSLS
jgi:hypothetical protein